MKKIFFGFLLSLAMGSSALALDVPAIKGRVSDYANILTPQQISDLDARLKQEEAATSNQIAILIIPSLEGEDVKDFSNRVFTDWKLGQKGKNNGVLIFQSTGDRKIRIEVGYGLEGALTDAQTSEIIRHDMVPMFKEKRFYEGYDSAISQIVAAVKGEFHQEPKKASDGSSTTFWLIILSVLAVSFAPIFISSLIERLIKRKKVPVPPEHEEKERFRGMADLPPIPPAPIRGGGHKSARTHTHHRSRDEDVSPPIVIPLIEDSSSRSSSDDSSSSSSDDDDSFSGGGGESGGGGADSSY